VFSDLDMRRGAIISAALHLAVIALMYFGLPHLSRTLPLIDTSIPIDIVNVADITNAPPPKTEPVPQKEEPPKPEPPKPEVKAPPPPPPPPEPEAKTPEPKPEPKPEAPKEVAEVPVPTAKPKQRPEPPVKDVKPEKKPPPPDEMASILKSVDTLKEQKKEQSPLEAAEALKEQKPVPREYNAAAPITISQKDAISRHFEKCWNVPAGAREAADLSVEIRVTLAPDATVVHAEFVDPAKLDSDPFYRAAAESAMRAVMSPLCKSLQDVGLQPDQYDQWKDLVITFNPKQMIGA
jgi:outer membrane biosynthesis protein TonB